MRQTGDRLLADGLRLSAVEDWAAALDHYARARRIFAELGDEDRVAASDQRAAMAYCDTGDLDEAIRLGQRVLDHFESVGDPIAAAKVQVNLGAALIQWYRGQDALPLLESALEVFREDPNRFVEQGTCHQNIGLVYRAKGDLDLSLAEQEEAIRLFRAAPPADAASHYPPPAIRTAHVELNLASVRFRLGDPDGALAGLARAEETFKQHGAEISIGHCKWIEASTCGRAGRYEDALAAAEAARDIFQRQGQLSRAGLVCTTVSRAMLKLGRVEEALDRALDAIAAVERRRHAYLRAPTRASWLSNYLGVYDVACEAALRTGRPALIAVLIELARTQALPRTQLLPDESEGLPPEPKTASPALMRSGDGARTAALAAAGELPLGPITAPMLNGETVPISATSPVRLDEIVRSVGGEQSWWWGSLATRERLWWSLVSPDGRTTAGSIPFGPNDRLRKVLAQLEAGIPYHASSLEEISEHLRTGIFAEPLGETGTFWADLGKAILPTPLIELLREADVEHPINLLIAPSTYLAQVPLGLLTVPGTKSTVFERAVLRLVPSAALLDALSYRKETEEHNRVRSVLLAVLDPIGDLPYARTTRLRARRRLTGSSGRQPATIAAVRSALRELSPGERGVGVFACHVQQRLLDASATAGLQLADGLLSSREFLLPDGPPLNSPERVLLSACASLGEVGGEWLALAPSLLFAGASDVVVSPWPVIEEPAARDIDERLARMLREAPDVASALRHLQLGALGLAPAGRAPRKRPAVPLSYRWGALTTVTCRRIA